jgi:hypothetical protein
VKTVLEHAVAETSLYDSDFYLWTQEQAALLRQVPRGSFALDIENLAEEIESMGRSEVSKVSSLLRQVLIHLLKMAIEPDSLSQRHWVGEVLTFQADAVLAFTPGMRQRIELDRIWKMACSGTAQYLESGALPVPAWPTTCPASLDELLAAQFDAGRTLERMKKVLHATASNGSQ